MTAADRPHFAALLALLAQTFEREVSEALATAYWHALEDLALADVQAAVQASMRTSRFFPRPAELRAALPSAIPELGEAYADLKALVRAYPYTRPPLDATMAPLVERLGGWRAVTLLAETELWHRFRQVYPALRDALVVRSGDARQALADARQLAPPQAQRAPVAVAIGKALLAGIGKALP